MFLVVCAESKETGSYRYSLQKDRIALEFLLWLLTSPPTCTFFFFNCFLSLPVFFHFAYFHPFATNPPSEKHSTNIHGLYHSRPSHPALCVTLTVSPLQQARTPRHPHSPEATRPRSRFAGPAAKRIIIGIII